MDVALLCVYLDVGAHMIAARVCLLAFQCAETRTYSHSLSSRAGCRSIQDRGSLFIHVHSRICPCWIWLENKLARSFFLHLVWTFLPLSSLTCGRLYEVAGAAGSLLCSGVKSFTAVLPVFYARNTSSPCYELPSATQPLPRHLC